MGTIKFKTHKTPGSGTEKPNVIHVENIVCFEYIPLAKEKLLEHKRFSGHFFFF